MKVPSIDFMGWRRFTGPFSITLVLLSIVALAWFGLNRGLDFTGGTLVEVEFAEAVEPQRIRGVLESAGYENGVVQYFGTEQDLLIRMPPQAGGDQALNQTLGRTTITSMTTLFVLLALLVAGGESIRGFAAALTIGIVVGTYSSIFVAAALLLLLNIKREDLLVPDKERLEQDRP